MSTNRYIQIDDEGYFVFDNRRVDDQALGKILVDNLRIDTHGEVFTEMEGNPAYVESFDAPLVARHVRLDEKTTIGDGIDGILDLPYGASARFPFSELSVDEWDRFHGLTDKGVPFVLSRHAQTEFFDLLEEFDDESVTVRGRRFPIPPWIHGGKAVGKPEFWTKIYREEENPGWELGRESVILGNVLPQLKLSKQRVLVLGAGLAHDAAYLARQGHVVTAVDFSEEAINRSRALYGSLENLKLVRADAFALPAEWNERFDLVFEHTCYCAVEPDKRTELMRQWKRLLAPGGHLLGVFFAVEKKSGPPYGGSEWEVRERLKKDFDFLFWTRWRHSVDSRKGQELVVYARKR